MKGLFLQDASVLLNLLATDRFEAMAAGVGWRFAICSVVRDEAKKLRDPATGELVPIDITPFIQSGVLQVLDLLGSNEQELFIENATRLDDGEAMSLAIAGCRQLDLALDDKAAIKYARKRFPKLCLWTTPEIIKHWADKMCVPEEGLRGVILRIESRARYFPPRDHALASWWQGAKAGNG